MDQNNRYRNCEGIAAVVRDGLCHRCGACVGVCPVNTLETDDSGYPTQVNPCIQCNRCVQVCPGLHVNFPEIGQALFGTSYEYGSGHGMLRGAYIGYSLDQKVRRHGASGGVVTQLLLHLLEKGEIDGALVAVADPTDPSKGTGLIARTPEEILSGAQSKYTTTPSLTALRALQKESGRFAVVGLPCQIHAMRNLQDMDAKWKERCPILIGLYCHSNLPCLAPRELASLFKPANAELTRIDFRQKDHAGWPQDTVELHYSDGSYWRSPFLPSQTVSIMAMLYPLGRCTTCIDFSAEFADIAVGDPWIYDTDGSWKYDDPEGDSSIIVRTEKAETILKDAVEAGRIATIPINPKEIVLGQSSVIKDKKFDAPFRMKIRRICGLVSPTYGLKLPLVSAPVIFRELLLLPSRIISHFPLLRRLAMRFLLSPAGAAIMRFRRWRKRRRAIARYRKLASRMAQK